MDSETRPFVVLFKLKHHRRLSVSLILLTLLTVLLNVGTTALVALHHGNKLFVANVGDSRGILCDRFGNVTPLSFDHKPNQVQNMVVI